MGYNTTQTIEAVCDDTCWEITVEVEFRLVGGCAPWQGSIYSCPSDLDWYGDAGDLEIDDIRIVSVVELDDDGEAIDDVELAPWEEAVVEQYALDNLDDDVLYEVAADQAEADFDEPDPDPDPEPYYYHEEW